jgi:hypothetical protein
MLAGEVAREERIERPSFMTEYNIEMDPKERVCEVMDWIHLAQDRVQWLAIFITLMNLPFQKVGKFND